MNYRLKAQNVIKYQYLRRDAVMRCITKIENATRSDRPTDATTRNRIHNSVEHNIPGKESPRACSCVNFCNIINT